MIMKTLNNPNKKLIKLASKFQSYDFGFLLNIEKQALRQMKEYHEHSQICLDNPKIARQIGWCLKLLDIIDHTNSSLIFSIKKYDDSIISLDKAYICKSNTKINTRNWRRFFQNNNTDWEKPVNKDCLRMQKAWYLYNRIRYYYMQDWWD